MYHQLFPAVAIITAFAVSISASTANNPGSLFRRAKRDNGCELIPIVIDDGSLTQCGTPGYGIVSLDCVCCAGIVGCNTFLEYCDTNDGICISNDSETAGSDTTPAAATTTTADDYDYETAAASTTAAAPTTTDDYNYGAAASSTSAAAPTTTDNYNDGSASPTTSDQGAGAAASSTDSEYSAATSSPASGTAGMDLRLLAPNSFGMGGGLVLVCTCALFLF